MRCNNLLIPLTASLAIALAACSSDGDFRAGGVSSAGTSTAGNDDSTAVPASDDSLALATGGLVGPEGIASTGLLANLGDPDDQNFIIANLLTETGETVNLVADAGLILTSAVDDDLAREDTITGTVIGVVQDTGDALIRTGEGDEYLVDGLVAAPGELVTVDIGESVLLGSNEASPLIGTSILSADQVDGSLATVGLASDGNLVNLDLALNDGTLGLDNDLTNSLSSGGTDALLSGTDTLLSSSDGLTGSLTDSVDSTLGGTTTTTSSVTSSIGGVVESSGSLLGDTTDSVGGTLDDLGL